VRERKSELARLETLDMGKPIAESEWDMDDVRGRGGCGTRQLLAGGLADAWRPRAPSASPATKRAPCAFPLGAAGRGVL
jgi:hypothetical protein